MSRDPRGTSPDGGTSVTRAKLGGLLGDLVGMLDPSEDGLAYQYRRPSQETQSDARINSFSSTELCSKDLTEHSEEVGDRKLRPKQRMLAKANHADTRRLGKIVTEDFAGCLYVTVVPYRVPNRRDSWYSDSTCMATIA